MSDRSPTPGENEEALSGESDKFYALLDCEDAVKWANHAYYTWFPGLKMHGNEWKWYKVFNGELPSKEELGRIKGIIITGSHHSVNQNDKWINELLQFIRDFDNMTKERSFLANNRPKMVGSCFGCQAIAKALGGVVKDNESNQFAFKIEEVRLHPHTLDGTFSEQMKLLSADKPLRVLVSHSESVLQVPDNSIVLASSSSTPNEMFLVNDNILAIQSHPELTPEIALEKIFPALIASGKIADSESDAVAQSLLTPSNDHPSVLSFLRSFLTE